MKNKGTLNIMYIMDIIIKFNEWLQKNEYSIEDKKLNDELLEEIIKVHKFKSGGRNELDKYMKILITKYNLFKNEEKVLEFKDIVKEFKKINKNESKNILKNEKKMDKKIEKGDRIIEVDETLNTDKLTYIEKFENALKEMCIDLMGEPINGREWKIKIMKNIYRIEIDENTKISEHNKISILVYGKKLVKRDMKLINDYLTKKRKIQKTIEKVNKRNEDKIKKEVIENDKDKNELYKELFGENDESEPEYEEEEKIEDLIIDLEEIEFDE